MSSPSHARQSRLHGRHRAPPTDQAHDDREIESREWTAGAAGGRPLDPLIRRNMERSFQTDFSTVRVHDDPAAAASAKALSAKAYTVGRDVYFAEGRFTPDTPAGQRLIAHELAHVVQQGRGGAAPALDPGGPLEQSADAAANAAVSGAGPVAVHGASGVGVARAKDDKDDPDVKKATDQKKPGITSKKDTPSPPDDKAMFEASRQRRASQQAKNAKNRERAAKGQAPNTYKKKADRDYDDKLAELDKQGHPDLPEAQKKTDLEKHTNAIKNQPKIDTPAANDQNLKDLYGTTLAARGFDNSVGVGELDATREDYAKKKQALEADPNWESKLADYESSVRERNALNKSPNANAPETKSKIDALDKKISELQPIKDKSNAADAVFNKLAISTPNHPDNPNLPSPGAKAGRGENTYVAIQIVDKDGTILASTVARNGGKKNGLGKDGKPQYFHAEENAMRDLRQQLGKGMRYPDARMVVVGDQVVCSEVCRPALSKFAEKYDLAGVDGHTFHETKTDAKGDTTVLSAKGTAQKATSADAPTSGNDKDPYGHLQRQDVEIYRKPAKKPGGDGDKPAPSKPPADQAPPQAPAKPNADPAQQVPAPPRAEAPDLHQPKAPPKSDTSEPSQNPAADEQAAKKPPADHDASAQKPPAEHDTAPKKPPPADEGGPTKKPPTGEHDGGSPKKPSTGDKVDAIGGKVGAVANQGAALVRAWDSYQENKDQGTAAAALAAAKTYYDNTDLVMGAIANIEAKRKDGQDPVESVISALSETGAGFIVPGSGADQGINGIANLVGAVDDHSLKNDPNGAENSKKASLRTGTDFIAGLTPSKMFSETIGAGSRAYYNIGKFLGGDSSGVDKFGDDAAKGKLGMVLQPLGMTADFFGNLGSGEGAGRALDKTLDKAKGSTIEKLGSASGDAFFELGQSKEAKSGKYGAVVQGWAAISSIGTDLINDKPWDQAINNAVISGNGGILETAGNAMGDAAYAGVERTKKLINEDIPQAKAAIKEKAAEVKADAVQTYETARETAEEYKDKAVETYESAKETVSETYEGARQTASEYKDAASNAVSDTYSGAEKRLKNLFTW